MLVLNRLSNKFKGHPPEWIILFKGPNSIVAKGITLENYNIQIKDKMLENYISCEHYS